MTVPTLDEIKALVEEHNALPSMLDGKQEGPTREDAPPRIEIARLCRQCGRILPPFLCGWGELIDQVRRNEPLPERLDINGCDVCCEIGEEED